MSTIDLYFGFTGESTDATVAVATPINSEEPTVLVTAPKWSRSISEQDLFSTVHTLYAAAGDEFARIDPTHMPDPIIRFAEPDGGRMFFQDGDGTTTDYQLLGLAHPFANRFAEAFREAYVNALNPSAQTNGETTQTN